MNSVITASFRCSPIRDPRSRSHDTNGDASPVTFTDRNDKIS